MSYTVQELARLAGVSVRTLHFYDEVGLLKPAQLGQNGYRYYAETELLRLQQILLFKELDFPLKDIKTILDSKNFNLKEALLDQKRWIGLKKDRLRRLMQTIDKTLQKLNQQSTMTDDQLYGDLSDEKQAQYLEEARQKWGHTEAFKQSQERVKRMGKEGLAKVLKAAGELTQAIAREMQAGSPAESPQVQALIAQHYDGLRAFYEPTLEMYRGLAQLYIEDARFKANYEKVAPGLAQFMHKSMLIYAAEGM